MRRRVQLVTLPLCRHASTSNPASTSAQQKIKYNPETLYSENVLLLPRLPIPNVQDTLQRYAETLPPLKSSNEVLSHLTKLRAFAEGSAENLNAQLRVNDAAAPGQYPFSYIESIWDQGYLAFRGPSPINISPGLGLKPIERIDGSQCTIAAQYVHACLRWYAKYVAGDLDIDPKNATCISQLPAQFGCARVPLPTCDGKEIVNDPKHIVVLHRGHAFRVDVFDKDGKALRPEAIARTMTYILEVVDDDNPFPVGVISAGGRTDYVAYMKELIDASPINADLLKVIRTAFLTVCLDSSPASDYDAKLQCLLHGIGKDRNNRWFDKHQLIVSKDGYVGMNFEHAFSDGMTWNRWMGEVWHHLNGSTHSTNYTPLPALELSVADIAPFTPLDFDVPPNMHGIINSSTQAWANACKNINQHTVVSDFGRKRLTKFGLSPDAFLQMSFHLAFFRLSGRMAPTYESCSTAAFFHGRTETIRSATMEMHAFVSNKSLNNVMTLSPEAGATLKTQAVAAAKRHVSLVKLAAQGLGVDRHLLALKTLANSSKTPPDDATQFFNDSLYGYSGNWQISSSNVSAPFLDIFNFGPVVENGYGLGYLIQEDKVVCSVSSFATSRKSNGPGMRDAILQAMRDISVVLGKKD
jgi:hypothetical protein